MMIQRVQCRRCTAHRDQALVDHCLVCGASDFVDVPPTPGDLVSAEAAAIAAAEHLVKALRTLAITRAGVMTEQG